MAGKRGYSFAARGVVGVAESDVIAISCKQQSYLLVSQEI
jgi:hypothetical protein